MSPDLLSAILRGVGFVLLFQSVGGLFFIIVSGSLLNQSAKPVRRIVVGTAAFGAVTLLAHLALDSARLTGEFSSVLDLQMQLLALGTAGAASRVLQIAGLLLLVAGVLKNGRVGRSIALVGAIATVSAFLGVGHTASHEVRWLLAPLLMIHLLVVAYWFGALLPLCIVVRSESSRSAAYVLERFSRFAVWLVPTLAVAGAVLMLGIARGIPDVDEPYGALMLTKVSVFALLMGLAALNKLRLVPDLRDDRPAAGRALLMSVGMEAVLLMGVLLVTAIMTSFYSP